MEPRTQTANSFEVFFSRLHESHEASAYEAIERLVQAGKEAGFGADTLIRMIDQGLTFEELLEIIESKMECSQKAA